MFSGKGANLVSILHYSIMHYTGFLHFLLLRVSVFINTICRQFKSTHSL